MPSYSLHEWETLPYGPEEGSIPELSAARLVTLARTSRFAGKGGSGVLEDRRQGLRARGVVGVLATPGCSLEILPKIDVAHLEKGEQVEGVERADNEDATIRKRLIHMLAVALNLKIDTGSITELDWQRETLLELLIRVFCDKLTETLRRGMPRRYLAHEEDLPALRGTLNVPRQFTRHAVNPARLACRFDELSEDIALNRIMKATVRHLSNMSGRAANLQRLRELSFIYADVTDVPPPALGWEEVVINRTNRAWRELLGMARLFLRNRYQMTSTGAEHGTALLFEMSALFEEFIGGMISRALVGTDYRVRLQGGRRYCLSSLDDERELFQTKPDILIRRDNKIVHLIDTKWKRISPRFDDREQGVSQADVYQMMAYARLYETPRLTLLYPHHKGLGDTEGVHARYGINDQKRVRDTGDQDQAVLEMASVDVADGNDLVDRLKNLVS